MHETRVVGRAGGSFSGEQLTHVQCIGPAPALALPSRKRRLRQYREHCKPLSLCSRGQWSYDVFDGWGPARHASEDPGRVRERAYISEPGETEYKINIVKLAPALLAFGLLSITQSLAGQHASSLKDFQCHALDAHRLHISPDGLFEGNG
jgi:hypothetical protein